MVAKEKTVVIIKDTQSGIDCPVIHWRRWIEDGETFLSGELRRFQAECT